MVLAVARRCSQTREYVLTHYSKDRIELEHYFAVREKKREIDYQASLTASKTAAILAKTLGG
jgi:hypothetical protein